MTFKELAEVFEKIENTSSRNEITQILLDLYSKITTNETQIVSYLLQGRVAPQFVDSEFNLAEKGLLKIAQVIAKKNGLSLDVFAKRKSLGDIGLLFEKISQGNETLEDIELVYDSLWKIVNTKGSGSVSEKYRLFNNLVINKSGIEAKYLSRIVVGNLRLGASVKTLLDAFSFVLNRDKKMRDELDRAYGCSADIGYIAKYVKEGLKLEDIKANPGVPVLSRLVERAKSFEEVIERMGGKFIVQPKFDGLRLQIHKSEKGIENAYKERIWFKYLSLENGNLFDNEQGVGKVKLFTRNLEDVTDMFPEIVEYAEDLPSSFILDSEVVGWDYTNDRFLSYQETMTRKRKYNVNEIQKSTPVRCFSFDIMYFNDQDVINLNTEERVELLKKVLQNNEGSIAKAQSDKITSVEELKKYFEMWVGMGLEGLIAKKTGGGYTPGSRDFDWIKLKKSFLYELNDTLDMVVLGYYLGSGKRADFGIGALLCGVLNKETENFECMCKLGTGFTDELWGTILKRLKPIVVKEKPKNVLVDKLLLPDVWVQPEVVVTVQADQITKAINKGENAMAGGYSLRFPRLIEFDRDKDIYEITTIEELSSVK